LLGRPSSPAVIDKQGKSGCGALGRETPRLSDQQLLPDSTLAVIDSRGRILRPPATEAISGLLSGMPVSPGVVAGPVRVVRTPHDKTVEKGDILVACTTDPGWTPLVVDAAAVVLEVGGALQHGALVAREYEKPCVTGIDRVVSTLQDGEIVEVDGATGIVRRLVFHETDRDVFAREL